MKADFKTWEPEDDITLMEICETGDKGFHFESDLPSAKDHLKHDHNKDDLDNEDDIMDYFRYFFNTLYYERS